MGPGRILPGPIFFHGIRSRNGLIQTTIQHRDPFRRLIDNADYTDLNKIGRLKFTKKEGGQNEIVHADDYVALTISVRIQIRKV
jgi:hypothetical protein